MTQGLRILVLHERIHHKRSHILWFNSNETLRRGKQRNREWTGEGAGEPHSKGGVGRGEGRLSQGGGECVPSADLAQGSTSVKHWKATETCVSTSQSRSAWTGWPCTCLFLQLQLLGRLRQEDCTGSKTALHGEFQASKDYKQVWPCLRDKQNKTQVKQLQIKGWVSQCVPVIRRTEPEFKARPALDKTLSKNAV